MKRLAWVLAALAVLLTIPGAVATTVISWTTVVDLPFAVGFALMGVMCAATGAVVASRVPGNAVGWIILGQGVGVGVLLAAGAYAEASILTSHGPLPQEGLAAWVGDIIALPVFFGLTGFLLLLFPTGRPLTPGWRVWAWVFGGTVMVATVSYGLSPGEVGPEPGVPNPLAVGEGAGNLVRVLADVTDWLALPAMILSALALGLRLRRSRGRERQQLKWFTCVASAAGLGLGLTVLTRGIVADVSFLVGLLGVAALPVTAGVAILRHRLYDIDIVIKRTLVYGPLTATLLGTYLVLVLLLRLVLNPLIGESKLAVAGSTLAVAALFRPVRARIQTAVDHRFFRSRYDAARTLEGFTGRLRDELDLESLGTDLRGVVQETMQPAHVSLWLRGSR
ncbi:MAG: hypothetical protein M4D85_00820 [Actinomycetota bacterium]|nr:hypothetical protein [Actinomycetota bacterium]MDQ3663752.1 hypothetical protein [Actinomycetota bacterium]